MSQTVHSKEQPQYISFAFSSHPAYFGERERYQAHNEQSTLHRWKETYWTTKQAVYKKLGKKQDEHIVASDAQLDAKLEVFKAIQRSCMDLLRAIELYQDRLCGELAASLYL